MKRKDLSLIFVCAWAFGLAASSLAQGLDSMDESQLIAVLKSDRSLSEKDAACARLKFIATAAAIPALADLLTDGQLSHSARYALEPMSAPAAGEALLAALSKTTGSNQVGIIHSLAFRRQKDAAPKLAGLLLETDPTIATAAADALGRIAGAEALTDLQAAAAKSNGRIHDAEVDALLNAANQCLTAGDRSAAAPIFQHLRESEKNQAVRLAAFRGMILSSDDGGVTLALNAIAGQDASEQGAALQAAARLPGGEKTTEALSALLAEVPPPTQAALLQCLEQRDDPSAAPAILPMLDSPESYVRLAACEALGRVGEGAVAVPLAQKAASANGAERDAARAALVNLRRGPVNQSMLDSLDKTEAAPRLELIRALGDRGDSAAAPALLKLARSQDDSIRSAALQAVALVAQDDQTPALVRLVIDARDADARNEAADALGAACQHIAAQRGHCDAQTLADAARNASAEARAALLPVCAGLTEAPAREALRVSLTDPAPAVRDAAMRALCDARDANLLPDLLKLTRVSDNKKIHTLAIRGCVRLATQEEAAKLSNEQKIDALKQMLDSPLDADEKRVVLSGLGSVPAKESLALLAPMLQDAEVQAEAAAGVIHVANTLAPARPPEAVAALNQVLALSSLNPDLRKSAQDALKAMQ